MFLVSGAVLANTFAVKNENDSGPGSLRAAIEAANKQPGGDVITFSPSVTDAIDLKSALPRLRGKLEIRGPGADKLTERPSFATSTPTFRVFTVAGDSTVIISGLRISNGNDPDGSGIYNPGNGALTLTGVVVSGNASRKEDGGCVQNDGRLTVRNSTFLNNESVGIINDGEQASVVSSTFSNNGDKYGSGASNFGTLTVRDSTFSENGGGGIFSYGNSRDPSRLTVVSSTFINNTDICCGGGGIKNSGGTLTLTSSTLSGNIATSEGGGVWTGDRSSDSFSLRTTIVANNEALIGPDAFGTFSSGGYNLIGDTAGASGFGPTDLKNVDAGLDPQGLQDNGGPTKTMALLDTSPAIDAVEVGCPPPTTDQRGVSRPQDGDGDTVARCDIGAYERRAP